MYITEEEEKIKVIRVKKDEMNQKISLFEQERNRLDLHLQKKKEELKEVEQYLFMSQRELEAAENALISQRENAKVEERELSNLETDLKTKRILNEENQSWKQKEIQNALEVYLRKLENKVKCSENDYSNATDILKSDKDRRMNAERILEEKNIEIDKIQRDIEVVGVSIQKKAQSNQEILEKIHQYELLLNSSKIENENLLLELENAKKEKESAQSEFLECQERHNFILKSRQSELSFVEGKIQEFRDKEMKKTPKDELKREMEGLKVNLIEFI